VNLGESERDYHRNDLPINSWYDRAWRKRKRLVLSGNQIPGAITGFPLLVTLKDDPDLARHARSDGRDILFTNEDGVTKIPHQRVVHQRMLREQGVWTIWTGPRAVRHVGEHDRTYVAYYTTNQGWWISSYDHHDHQWQHFQLRSHEASADGRWWDDHNNPAITFRLDGRIVAVYGEHSRDRSWCRISTNPEDITSWDEESAFVQEQWIARRKNAFLPRLAARLHAKITGRPWPHPYEAAYSYVNLYTLPDGTLWRQYRPVAGWAGHSRRPSFVTSKDGGETWSKPTRFLEEKTRTPYLVTAQNGNKIHFFFTDGHPDEWDRTSIYHAYYDHSDGTYRRSDGSLIGGRRALPFAPADATKIFDGTTSAGEAWVYHVAVDKDGNVAGVFNVYSGELAGRESHRVHDYWYAYWDGKEWRTSRIASEKDIFSSGQRRYSGGIVVDPEDLGTVYLSLVDPTVEENSHSRHIWRYRTVDYGATWTRSQVSNSGQGKAHSRPVVPLNRHPDLPLFWQYGHYVNYLEYWTGLAAGDHGDLLDSEHYVKLSRVQPGEDVVLYVYYGNPDAGNQAAPESVWPESCLLTYRGSLTQNDLRQSLSAGGKPLTIELTATWASNRKGGEAVPILSNLCDGAGILIAKTADQHLETRIMSAGREKLQVYDDLTVPTREWQNAFDPIEKSVIQVKLVSDSGVHVWLNGRKSRNVGALERTGEGKEASPSTLRVGCSPHSEEAKFQGWIDSIRIYEGEMDDTWLALSYRMEHDHAGALHIGREEEEPG